MLIKQFYIYKIHTTDQGASITKIALAFKTILNLPISLKIIKTD